MGTALFSAVTSDVAGSAAKTLGNVVRTLTTKEKSIIDFARIGQITPLVAIDSDIRHNANIKDVLHLLTTLYTGFYMQALAYEDLLGDLKIVDRLENFSPNYASPRQLLLPALESRSEYGLGFGPKASLEAYNNQTSKNPVEVVSKENQNELHEDRSLAVGKSITLKLHDKFGNSRPIPVTVRLIPAVMSSDSMVAAYALGSRWNSMRERRHRVNQGELHWFWDGWLKLDMIEEHRRALLNDKSGVYRAISERRSGKLLENIIRGRSSLATAAAMTIMSEKTSKELERRLGGRLSNAAIRERLFDESGLMILVVFDPTHEQLFFYFRGSPEPAHYSMSEVKSSGKKKDVDMLELINTFMNKGTPSF